MKGINAWAQVIKQGGLRRAANMAVLRVDHPDIEEFVACKLHRIELQAFNLSVGITDAFMNALALRGTYAILDPRTGKEIGRKDAIAVWKLSCEAACTCGDPGVLFLDTINASNPTPQLGCFTATNPCGEQPLLPYESCNLGSINLSEMVRNRTVDWDKLRETTFVAVRFLDDVIDVNHYPLPRIERMTKANRKIGLGIMGLAHMLVRLGIPYDSEKAVETAGEAMRYVSEQALEASRQLAEERNPFPNFEKSVYAERGEPPVRNATRTTVAPTGTGSIIANTSSGIEPIFSVAYKRKALDKEFLVFDPLFREMAEANGVSVEGIARQISERGSVQDIPEVPDDWKFLSKTAHEIPAERHVRMQAAVQRYTDNAVSKTVNLPHDATPTDVSRVFLLAHQLRCKGITVFRQNSRAGVLGSSGFSDCQYVRMRERAKVICGQSEKFRTGCGSLYVHVDRDDKGLLEVFSNLGKGGACPAQSEATARLVSLCLRCDVDPREVVRQLQGIRCPTACSGRASGKPVDVSSCPDAIAQAIRRILGEGQGETPDSHCRDVCPLCGGVREPGRCGICLSCWKGGCQPA
jgi:ribonucleoside-diphosphate reductase alpha chain